MSEASVSGGISYRREVEEESGVLVRRDSVRFLASQPWAMPQSLMIGFHADTVASSFGAPHDPRERLGVEGRVAAGSQGVTEVRGGGVKGREAAWSQGVTGEGRRGIR